MEKQQNLKLEQPINQKNGLYYYDASAEGYVSINNGNVNITKEEIIEITLKLPVYGVKRNIASSSVAWTRIESSVGKSATAVKGASKIETTVNDFDNIYPWSDIKTCALSPEGEVLKYSDEADWDWTAYDYIMTEVPEFWWDREQKTENGATWEYIYISEKQTKLTPNKSEKFYIGRYTATGTKSSVDCKNNKNNLVDISITDLRQSAQNIGENWRINGYMEMELFANALSSRICRL